MTRNRYILAGVIIVFLALANVVYYVFADWGLITVKVQDAPLGQVIKSIEWQGWVKIYSNIDPSTKVSMYVDKVPLPVALETLAVNIDVPRRNSNSGNQQNGTPPNGGNGPGGRGGGGGFGGGGFGRGAQWSLAFFVGATPAAVKSEIQSFEAGNADDNLKIYNYPTRLGMALGANTSSDSDNDDSDPPVPDPRLQTWPGIKPVVIPVSASPAPDPAAAPGGTNQQTATADPPTSVQGYLQTFAQAADIFIMSDTSWDPSVANPPPVSSSIVSAIKDFVGHNHGAYTEAFVLQGRGQRGDGGGRGFAGDNGWNSMDRMRNLANGLPDDARASALSQIDQMDKLQKEIRSATPEQRTALITQAIQTRMANNPGGPMSRMSPEKQAARMAQMVSNRMTAQGK